MLKIENQTENRN